MGEKMDFIEWLEYGVEQKWVSDPFCSTHDGDPYMSEEEMQEWEDGGDPCCPVLKILEDNITTN
jgi:hypothetical protein